MAANFNLNDLPNESDMDTKVAMYRGAVQADVDSVGGTSPRGVLGPAVEAYLQGDELGSRG